MQKNFQRYLEAIQYKITGGQEHGWNCYPNARYYDSDTEHAEVGALVDAVNDVVYEITVSEAGYSKPIYRWINPDYVAAHASEAESRNVDPNQAYDDVAFWDTDSFDDIIAKVTAMVAGEEYDERVVMSLDMPEDVLFNLYREAHRRDITANQLITEILESYIDHTDKPSTNWDPNAVIRAATDPDITGYQGA